MRTTKTITELQAELNEAKAIMQQSAQPGLHSVWMRAYRKANAAREQIRAMQERGY